MSNQQRSARTGIALSLVCLGLLGTMPIVSNSRPAGTDAFAFAFALSVWQVVFALPAFGLELARGEKGILGEIPPRRELIRLIFVAVFTGGLFGLATYLYVLGVEKAGAANAAIAIQAYPPFSILWESLFLKRRKSGLELALTGLMIAALYYLGTGGTLRMSGLSPWFLVALGVPFMWSIAHVMIKEELGRTPVTPIQVTFFRVAISTAFLFAILLIANPATSATAATALFQPASSLMGLVYFLELLVWFYAVRHIDVSLASSITAPWPIVTMALAAIVLGDAIAAYQIVALVVALGCIYGITLASLRKAANSPWRNLTSAPLAGKIRGKLF